MLIHRANGTIASPFDFPVDEPFQVTWRKVKGKSKSRGVEVAIEFAKGCIEGFEKLTLTMPYDGEQGTALLMAGALQHSKRVVKRAIAEMEAAATAAAAAAAVSTPVNTSVGSSTMLSPMMCEDWNDLSL